MVKETSCLWPQARDRIEAQGHSGDNGDEKRIHGIPSSEATGSGKNRECEAGADNAEA